MPPGTWLKQISIASASSGLEATVYGRTRVSFSSASETEMNWPGTKRNRPPSTSRRNSERVSAL